MSKLILNDLSSLTNEQTAIASINANNTKIETAIENTISRDGAFPNEMEGNIDMNSHRILNLQAAANNTEPVRKQEFDDILTTITSGVVGDLDIVIATKAEAEAGTNNTKFMTPLRTTEEIAASPVIDAIETEINNVLAGIGFPTVQKATVILLNADITEPLNTLAIVYADPGGDPVNGLYIWNGTIWTRVGDAPFANHEARLDTLEANTANLTATAPFGKVPVKSKTDTKSFSFDHKFDLAYATVSAQDLSDSDDLQVAVGTSATLTVGKFFAGPVLNLVQSAGTAGIGAVMTSLGVFPDYSYVFKYKVGGNTNNPQTVALVLSPSTPTLGGANTVLPLNAEVLTWRGDASLVQSKNYEGAGAGTLTISNVVNQFGALWTADAGSQDELTWRFVSDSTGGQADCFLSVNGVEMQSFHVSGISPGWYIAPGFYFNGLAQSCRFLQISGVSKSLDVNLEIFVDPAAPNGNTGKTIDSPLNIQGVTDFMLLDSGRRSVTFSLANGNEAAYRGLLFNFDPAYWRDVTIRAQPGAKPVLTGMYPIASGTAAWTQPNAATAPNVWMTPLPGNVSGVIQVGRTQTCGLNNLTTLEDYLYTSANYTDSGTGAFIQASLATMNNVGNKGFVSMQLISGPDIGKMYIHTADSDNPNNYTWMVPIEGVTPVIQTTLARDTDPVDMKLTMDGINMKYVYQGAKLDKIEIDIRNCNIDMCSVASPWQLNACKGRMTNCRCRGSISDFFHGDAAGVLSLGTLTLGSPIVAISSFYNTDALKVGSPITATTFGAIPAGTTILSIDTPLQLTMSANAAIAGVTSLSITSIPRDTPAIVFDNCYCEGGPTKTPTTPTTWNCDGWSNHQHSSRFILNNCESKSCNGSGFAAGVDASSAYNFKASDQTGGWVSLIVENGQHGTVEAIGGLGKGNASGIKVFYNDTAITGPGTTTFARINAANVAFRDTTGPVVSSQHGLGAGANFLFMDVDNCFYTNGNTTTLGTRTVLSAPTYLTYHNP